MVESIVEQIVRQIQAGKLQPGDKLPSERQLIEMLKVSRSSVREALQGLEVMGLGDSHPGQGTFINNNLYLLVAEVNNPTLPLNLQRDMRLKLIEARRIVEGNIAQIAAERATDAAIAVLRTTFENYRELVEHNSYQLALTGPHHEFHIALAELTENAFFTPLVETLLRAVPQGLRESEFTAVGEPEDSLSSEVEIHRAILDAVADRKPAAARSAMEEHMDFEQRLVTQVFRDKTRTY